MPGLDWFPGVSQLKSTFQLITGDVDGALETQANFFHECPGVSQVTSLGQVLTGDVHGAVKTQKRCLGTINNVADAIPVVGHVKGVVHYAVGDTKGGNQAMNAATRSTVVMGSGAIAGLTTGGLAAIPAGIAAGATYDTVGTVVTDKPQGFYAAIDNAVKNPSAGNIFDAAFVPVGDGLAGYAGGKLANNVANSVKINSLETARASKLARLEAAMEGKVDMTSAQAQALGSEINALTSQINVIKHGTPKFWYDPKNDQVLTKPNNNAVAIAGYIDEEDPEKRKQIVKDIYSLQENAYTHDSMYLEYGGTCTTPAAKRKVLNDRQQQKAKTNLKRAYQNISVVTETDMTQSKRDFEQKKHDQKAKEAFNVSNWLHVPMPRQFNFTGAIMTNCPHQGLLHTLARHGSQWSTVIPNFRQEISRLPNDIQQRLRAIENEPNAAIQQQLLTDLDQILSTTAHPDTVIRIHELEMEIYRYLRNRITYGNYVGEGVNTNGHVQYYFEVTDINGQKQIMVICPSDQLYSPDNNFGDPRPIRTITTVFFVPYSKLQKLKISKMF